MRRSEGGFTIIEVLIAIVVMAVGIIALAGSAGMVTRMIGRGQRSTRAAQGLERQLDSLRQAALVTSPSCTALSGGSASLPNGVTATWTVSGSGRSRTIRVVARYPDTRSTRADTITTAVLCP